ncbi:MAG: bifunctional oligoribonuclease/PAP phosphatase NrnA [Actinobacteria bacterium]|nr:bifunctional oligoribonuclease/PAP phosphatase NrnA [Actinomycetota bacterium]NBY15911.1 bifunctional oligoribonuclease/PAP phosphatase NrnA [Actinomycetota bacterium]
MIEFDQDWTGAVELIEQAQSVLLIAHVCPDPDALGSALAIGLALESLNKKVQVSVGEPGFAVPESLQVLPGKHLVVAPENLEPADLVISCDTSSHERLGVLEETLACAENSIAIDHHPSFTGFGKLHLVDPDAAATAELALELIDLLKVELNADIASAIYAGLATDTGSFRYNSTTAYTMQIAARLFATGIDHAKLAIELFDNESFEAIQMLADALKRAQLLPDAANGRGLVYTSISVNERRGLPELAMERVIDTLRRTSEAEVSAIFKQGDDGLWKGSLRSKTTVDVGAVGTALGGGGHSYAAGYTGSDNLEQMILDLKEALAKV